jgi:tetratricopeptide (TPR) repeat protein
MTKGTRPAEVQKQDTSTASDISSGRGSLRRYGKLLVGCVFLAGAITALVAYWSPLEDVEELPPEEVDAGVISNPVSSHPTIELPTEVVEISAEELRAELQRLGADLLSRFSEVPEALHAAALLHADLQQVTEAERIWRDCIRLSPKHVGPYVGLATAAMKLGKDEEALATLQQAISAGCVSPELDHQLAAALTKLGRLSEAAEVLQSGLVRFPDEAQNWLQLGQIQIQLGQFAEAETSLQQAIVHGTTDGSVLFSLANACARQGKQEEAARHRQMFQERKSELTAAGDTPFQLRYDAELRQIALASFCRAGTVYDRQGDLVEAERLLLRALALGPDDLVVCGELTAFYRRLGRIADARLVQRRMVAIQPQNIVHLVNLASLASQLGDLSAAESALKEVIGKRPDLSIGYSGLAQLYLQMDDLTQARWFAEAALRMEPVSPDETTQTYMVLATICGRLGDRAAAETALAEARRRAAVQTGASEAEGSSENEGRAGESQRSRP